MSKINKALEIAADAIDEIGPVKALKSLWDGVVSMRIESVFKNCAEQLNGSGTIEEKFKEKLHKYAESDFGQETVYALIQKSITADSKECCKIIGIILGLAMSQNRTLTQEERVLSEALRSITDSDLELLKKTYHSAGKVPTHPEIIKQAAGDKKKLQEQIQKNSLSIFDYYKYKYLTGNIEEDIYSIERLKRLDILTAYSLYGGRAVAGTRGLFKFTQLSVRLIELSEKVV